MSNRAGIAVALAVGVSLSAFGQAPTQQTQKAQTERSGVTTFLLRKGTLIERTYYRQATFSGLGGTSLAVVAMVAESKDADRTKFKAVRFEIGDEIAQLDLDEAESLITSINVMMRQAMKWSAGPPDGDPELTFSGHDEFGISLFWTGSETKLLLEVGSLKEGQIFLDSGQLPIIRKAVADAITLLATK